MKILYHHRVAARDGMDVHITELIRAFRALGHDVIVVGPDRGSEDTFGNSGALVSRIRTLLPNVIGELLELVYDRLAFRRLERAYLAHRPDALYERHNLFLAAGKRLKEKYGLPYLLEVNSPLAQERAQHGGLALRGLAGRLEVQVWKSASHVFPVSHVLARYIEGHGVDPSRILVVPNGVNPEQFHPGIDGSAVRKKYHLGDNIVVLGFTGFVRAWHGLDGVIEAMASGEMPDRVKLFVVGDGPARSDLEALARSKGLAGRVIFTGVVARPDVPAYIAAFDIALQPAVTPYASPLKLFEYMAMGKAIIAPDQENIREILTDGETAMLADTDRTFSSLGTSLCTELALRQRLGNAAALNISEKSHFWLENGRRILGMLDSGTEASENDIETLISR